jgi:hypothetical protein
MERTGLGYAFTASPAAMTSTAPTRSARDLKKLLQVSFVYAPNRRDCNLLAHARDIPSLPPPPPFPDRIRCVRAHILQHIVSTPSTSCSVDMSVDMSEAAASDCCPFLPVCAPVRALLSHWLTCEVTSRAGCMQDCFP